MLDVADDVLAFSSDTVKGGTAILVFAAVLFSLPLSFSLVVDVTAVLSFALSCFSSPDKSKWT